MLPSRNLHSINFIKRPVGIIVVSVFALFLPLTIRFVSILPELIFFKIFDWKNFLLGEDFSLWWVLGFYGFLGLGVYKLNKWARWILVIHMVGLASLAPLSIVYSFLILDKETIVKAIQKHGLFETVALPWLGVFLNSVIAIVVLVYLFKIKVRKLFVKQAVATENSEEN